MCISYLATLRMVFRELGAVRNLELGNGSRWFDDEVDWLCGVDAIPRFWKVGGMRAQGAWVVSTPEMRNTSSIDPRVESFERHGRRETVFDKKWAGCSMVGRPDNRSSVSTTKQTTYRSVSVKRLLSGR